MFGSNIKIKFKISIVVSMLFACLMISCEPRVISMTPLSPADSEEFDERLIGVWIASGEDERVEVHVMEAGSDGWTLGFLILYYENDPVRTMFFLFTLHTTYIGNNHYINLKLFGEDDCSGQLGFRESKSYEILKYEIFEDTLMIWEMSTYGIAEAFRQGKIRGTFTENSGPIITDSAKNIAIFLQKVDHNSIFHTPTIYRKLKVVGQDTIEGIYQPPF